MASSEERFSDLIKEFFGFYNPDLILALQTTEEDNTIFVEYIASVEVDNSSLPDYQKELESSYNPDYY